MEVIFTSPRWDLSWASPELAAGYRGFIFGLRKEALECAGFLNSKKTLVVVNCFCWWEDKEILCYAQDENYVLVSPFPLEPFKGVDVKIHTLDILPPHKNPGAEGEASTPLAFLMAWGNLIHDAVIEASLPEAIVVVEE